MHTSHAPRRVRSPRVAPAAVAGLVVAASLSATMSAAITPTAAKAKADLVVTQAAVDRTKVAEGDTLNVSHVVRNKGTKKADATRTRFYLTRDVAASLQERKVSTTNPRSAPADIRLVGVQAVKAIKPGKSRSLPTVELTVPIGTQPARYSVLVCADDYGKVAEKNEGDNCVVAGKPVAVQAPVGNEDLLVQSFADTAPWPDADDEAADVRYMKAFCAAVHPTKPLTFGGAIEATRDLLLEKEGSEAMQQLADSGLADTAVGAQSVAAIGFTQGAPGLALAGLLRAHELEPRNAGHLVNLAAVAVTVDLPNEALAFLDGAASRDFRTPALGMSQQAIGMTVRGQAFLMLGRTNDAEAMFKAAKRAEPMLAEADAGLANVEACKGNDVKAVRYMRKSRQRSDEKDTTTPTEDPVRPGPAIDLGQGVATPLRQLPIAETPSQAVDMEPLYDAIRDGLLAESQARNEELTDIQLHLNETDDARTRAEKRRRDDIISLVYDVGSEPDLTAMRKKIRDKIDVITEHREEFWGGGTGETPSVYRTLSDEASDACIGSDDPSCWITEMNATCIPEYDGYHSDWRAMISEAQTLSDEYFAVMSKRMSAYASNLLDEEAHRLVLLTIESSESGVYGSLVQQGQQWTHYAELFEEECVEWQPEPVEDPEAPGGAQSKGPCSKDVAAMNYVALLGPTKVKVNCEKVTQELSHEVIPLLHVFGEIDFNFRTGRFTIFVGSKGEGKLGVVEGGFKSGVYITSERNGDIYDVGWRVGPSASVVGGAAEFQAFEELIDISFIGRDTTGIGN